jgi:hypothetical protein
MFLRSSIPLSAITLFSLVVSLVSAHTVITYPGWRGDNLHSNGSVEETEGLVVAEARNGSGLLHPYGMQWEYPCMSKPHFHLPSPPFMHIYIYIC